MKKNIKKPKIIIAYQYLSFKGGIEEVIYNQSALLKKMGYSVELLTSRYGEKEKSHTSNNVYITRTTSINFTYKLFGIPFAIPVLTPSNLKKIVKKIKNADVINVHGHPYLASFVYILIAKLYKKPIILTQHNTNISSNSVVINTVYSIFDKTVGKYNLNNSTKIVAVSGETKKYVETLTSNKENIEVIYNGVDTKRFHPNNSKNLLRKKYSIPTNKFVCLTVRRLTFKNGIETFLNTAKQSDQNKTLFLLGGTGPDKDKIAEYVKENNIKNVMLLGFIKDEDLASYYSLSDVFILPSIQGEGFPMVVLESFSSGTPVIATKSGGHIEVIKNGEAGYLVNVNDSYQIHKYIEYLVENKRKLKQMSINSRAIVENGFSWKRNVDQLVNLINLSI